MRFAFALVPLVTFGLAVGAAGAKPRDACALLAKAQVAAALGEPVASAKGAASATGAVYSTWTGKDAHVLPRAISLVAGFDHVELRYKGYVQLLRTRKPVAGVGVAAVTDGSAVVARSARAVVQVGASLGSGVKLATVEALAREALARA